MPRPRLCRRIRCRPRSLYYKPRGIPMRHLEEVNLSMEELEAIRLVDYLDMEQIEAAKKMKTSQSTLQRILASARKKTSDAIVNGKAVVINR